MKTNWYQNAVIYQNYRRIDPKFGTMQDFDRLLEECHGRGLKVIMDMAVNHTSTEHPWFKEAVRDPESPYRDYYIIRRGKTVNAKLLPPTNWESTFTGSAWERIGDTEDFYLHLFCKEQADLNWENPKVREEVVSILTYWLEKGVDGFRFGHLDSDNIGGKKFFWKPFDLREFKKGLLDPQTSKKQEGWNTIVLENHDNARSVSRRPARYRLPSWLGGSRVLLNNYVTVPFTATKVLPDKEDISVVLKPYQAVVFEKKGDRGTS